MDLKLTGKRAVITAASKGIGLAIAEKLAEEGAHVILCSRREEAIKKAAERIADRYQVNAEGYAVDLADVQSVMRFAEQVGREHGQVDALVCNSGGPPGGSFLSMKEEDWDKAFQTNLMSVVRLVREFYPWMKANGGRIVTIASTSVKVPIEGLVLSNTMRTGVAGLMKTLSMELAADGILVNTVCPGRIATDRLAELDGARAEKEGRSLQEIESQIKQEIPLRRYGEPEELADLAAFLLSPRNRYLTGSTYFVDGGMMKSL
ncbi:SDR family oxidoreductase [Paenibacillus senegalensis]|uniref:SDR family oxidoreductase n=1 Tax=Paenibacillus senegalensis TaxID=1465766 RepID=UPI0002893A69|nr:SDR family oxidoreductase [Paenibacillus senegalensis]